MQNKIGLTRKQYKDFKKMDHKTMENFIVNLYNEGVKDGKTAAGIKKVTSSNIAIAISEVKGIGTKKAAEIMEAVNKLFNMEQQQAK